MLARAAIAVSMIFGAAAPVIADERSEALVEDFIAWVDSAPDWSASADFIRSSGADTFAEGVVFARAEPNVSISIETLRLRGLIEAEAGGFRAEEIDVGGADIVSDDLRYTIPSTSVANVYVPTVTGFNLDPRRLMTMTAQAYSTLSKAEFSNLQIPEMTSATERSVTQDGDTVAASSVYRNLEMGALKDGAVQDMSAGPFTVHVEGPEGTFDFTVNSATSDRFDIGALAHVFDPAAYRNGRGDRIWRPILSSLTYSDITGTGPEDVVFRLDSVIVEGIDGRQLDKPFTAVWDRMLDLTVPDEEKQGLFLDFAESYQAWRLGTMKLEGLAFEAPRDDVGMTLDSLTMAGVSSDGIDNLDLDDFDVTTPDGILSLGSLKVAGFVSPDLAALLDLAALDGDIDAKTHADLIEKSFAGLPRIDHFGIHDVTVGESRAEAFSLESLTFDFSAWNDLFAESTDMRMTGLDIPPALLGPESAGFLDVLGYDDLVIGLSLSDRWTPETGKDEATWKLSLGGAADFKLFYELSGVTMDWIVRATAAAAESEDSEDALKAMLDELRLERASFSVTDRSLLERAFALAADLQDLDVDGSTYREQMRAALPFLISAAMPPAITRLLAKPLQQFLAGRQTLIAEIEPPAPLNVTEFLEETDDPLELPDRLNMTLRTEEP